TTPSTVLTSMSMLLTSLVVASSDLTLVVIQVSVTGWFESVLSVIPLLLSGEPACARPAAPNESAAATARLVRLEMRLFMVVSPVKCQGTGGKPRAVMTLGGTGQPGDERPRRTGSAVQDSAARPFCTRLVQ